MTYPCFIDRKLLPTTSQGSFKPKHHVLPTFDLTLRSFSLDEAGLALGVPAEGPDWLGLGTGSPGRRPALAGTRDWSPEARVGTGT